MKVITTAAEMKKYISLSGGKSIGFVPTMGYLHEGHLSLIERAAAENDITIVSIFVNPIQFGAGEDLDKYPRDFKADEKLAEKAEADLIFYPQPSEMYPKGYGTFVSVEGEITSGLCGASRPGHFTGVATVVLKLFNIVKPDNAYFGQKDAQQLAVIKRMAKDLNLDVKITGCPIVREKSGLAKSSRNTYLSPGELDQAAYLYKSLTMAASESEKNSGIIKEKMADFLEKNAPLGKIDYIEMVNAETMEKVDTIIPGTLIALAVKFPSARLIDNILVGEITL